MASQREIRLDDLDDLETDSDHNKTEEKEGRIGLTYGGATGSCNDDYGMDVTDGRQRGTASKEDLKLIAQISNKRKSNQSSDHVQADRWQRCEVVTNVQSSPDMPSVDSNRSTKGQVTPAFDTWGNISMSGSVGYQSAESEEIEEMRQMIMSKQCPGYDEEEQNKELADHFERMKIQGAQKMSPGRRRSLEVEEEDEQAREIQELVSRGLINKNEAEQMIQGHEMQQRLNRASEEYSSGDRHRPPRFDNDGIPVSWSQDSSQLRNSPAAFILVELKPGHQEYDQIEEELRGAGVDIVQVTRLQNVHLLDRFKSEMDDLVKRRQKGFDLNVRYLYHGTTVNKRNICEEGLDQRLSRMGFFGKGIYFSDNPLKCVHYTNPDCREGEETYLLKCRVILGTQKCFSAGENDTSLKREPEKQNPAPGEWRFYDSVLGCPKDYNEFVVYDNRRAMIEYIISFKINAKGKSALRSWTASPTSYLNENTKNTDGVKVPETDDDEHFENISRVRETIRKKRCEERGVPYIPANETKKKKDKLMWQRLQKLHMPEKEEQKSNQQASGLVTYNELRQTASNPSFPDDNTGIMANQTQLPHSQSYSYGDDTSFSTTYNDAVGQVTSMLISNFLDVTSCDNIEIAKFYLEKNDMDVEKALVDYYDNMP